MNDTQSTSEVRFVRRAITVSLILALAATCAIFLLIKARPALTARAVRDAAFSGDYAAMENHLAWLEAHAEATLYHQAVLEAAQIADYNGDADTALSLLSQPVPADSEAYDAFAAQAEALAAACTYRKALRLYEEGAYMQSARLAATVRHYEPAAALQQMAQNAYEASLPTPIPTPTTTPTPSPTPPLTATPTHTGAPTAAPTPSPSPLPALTLLSEGRIAVGAKHTVVLREDGTVAAFGDNACGQTDVSTWKDIVFVAAGAYHTLGLTRDGRVLACGDNTHMQTDVAFYSGVKAIAANDYASALLTSSGDVFTTGFNTPDFLQGLSGVEHIYAGSYGLLVKTPNGLAASHPGFELGAFCERIALSRGYAIGVDGEGVVHSSTPLIPAWTDVEQVASGETVALALTVEGRVLAHVFDAHSRYDFAFDQPVAALAAGANHCAFLLADGTLSIHYSDGRQENLRY